MLIRRLHVGGEQVRPAWVVVAGVDPRHGGSVAVADEVAAILTREYAAVLEHVDVYIVSSLNPDGIAGMKDAGKWGESGRNRAAAGKMDADRDGRFNEDPALDLDGDGRVLWMRVKDPAPGSGLVAEYVAEESDTRVMRRADRAKGERPVYALVPECRDTDGDGLFGEDGFEGVELDRNFPYHWAEYHDEAGRVPLSEPETRGLAEWLLAHPNVVGVVEYAPGDTLVNVPPGGKMDETGEAPQTNHVLDADRGVYERVGEKFREITRQKEAPSRENGGTLQGWAYAQLGVWSFSTPVWVRPDQLKIEEKKEEAKKPEEPKPEEAPKSPPTEAKKDAPPAAEQKSEKKKIDSEEGKWMAYSDGLVAAGKPGGFAEWKAFKHPQLGDVEIGGFLPGFRADIPAAEVSRLAAEQAKFIADLAERSPRFLVRPVVVDRLGDGVWRITVQAVNKGKLPTPTAMGVKVRRVPPTRWTIGVERTRILAGERNYKMDSVPAGGEFGAAWTIAGAAGDKVVIRLISAECGEQAVEITLGESGNKEAQP